MKLAEIKRQVATLPKGRLIIKHVVANMLMTTEDLPLLCASHSRLLKAMKAYKTVTGFPEGGNEVARISDEFEAAIAEAEE